MTSANTPEGIEKEIDALEKIKNRWLTRSPYDERPAFTYEYLCEQIERLKTILKNMEQ